MRPHRVLDPLVLLGVTRTKRPHEFGRSEETGTESEKGEKKFREKAFHSLLSVRGETRPDDVAATELPFRRHEEESQHLLVNDAVRERNGQCALPVVADAGNGGIPHTLLSESRGEKRP